MMLKFSCLEVQYISLAWSYPSALFNPRAGNLGGTEHFQLMINLCLVINPQLSVLSLNAACDIVSS